MEQDIKQMKFQELRQYAKQLGLTDIKKSMNKEQIIEAINKFKENVKPIEAESNEKVKKTKTKSKATKTKDNDEEVQEEPKKTEKQTKKKKTKKSENLEDVNEPEKVLQTKQNNQEEQIVKENTVKTKKTKRSKKEHEELESKEEAKQEVEVVSSNEQIKKKKVSKKSVKENQQSVDENQKQIETKKNKKTKKNSSKNKQVKTQSTSVNANLHEDSQETKDFKLELEDDENSQHQAVQEPLLPIAHVNNLNNSSLLTNDLSGNEDAKLPAATNQDPNITEDIQNNTFDKSKPDFNPIQNKTQTICVDSTVVADQPTSGTSNNAIEPSTFVPCTSFYKQQNKEVSSEPLQSNSQAAVEAVASPKPQPKQGGARIVRPKQTITEIKIFKHENTEVEVVTKKVVEMVKNEAGPRIVKPVILYANEVCETTESNKRKLNDNGTKKVTNNKVKKPTQTDETAKVEAIKPTESSKAPAVSSKNTIVAKAVPDFKAIHQKEENKKESVVEYLQRKQERFNKLTKTPSSSIKQNPVSRLFQKQQTTENSKATNNGLEKPKMKTPTTSMRVAAAKFLGKSKNSPRQQATSTPKLGDAAEPTASLLKGTFTINIPKISQINTEKPIEDIKTSHVPTKQPEKTKPQPLPTTTTEPAKVVSNENNNLSTPTKTNDQMVNQTKTPASTLKRVSSLHQSSLLKSAQKVQQYKLVGSTFQQKDTSSQSQSSFDRRKSFDLNASLSKPLTYNPHVGKLKPVDFSAKSIFLSAITANLNNETKLVDKSNALKQTDLNSTKTKSPKSLDLAKKRLSTIKMSGIRTGGAEINRNMITEQAKINNLKVINDESLQSTKKFRQERTKQQRITECDKRRHMENVENM